MQFPSDKAKIELAIDQAIAVADEIILLAEEENRRLESGRPVQMQDLLERKSKLVAEFSAFFKSFNQNREAFLFASDEKFNILQDRVQSLAQIIFQNASSLTKAANANERRIKTIMRAVRENQQHAALTSYGDRGQQAYGSVQPVSIKRSHEV
ncbi:flagellar export chaperone FlgN [Cohaesibacter celericrescens]|nr:flagellar export chaperone FlgN [Cohaesibacter celericrescens]